MKNSILVILLLFSQILTAQNDTLIIANNYKFKVGVKGLIENSGAFYLTPETKRVYNIGAQVIYKLGNSKSSIESGVYYYTRSFYISDQYVYAESIYRNIHLPINYRLDTRIIYFALGFYVDYLLVTEIIEPWKNNELLKNDKNLIFGYNVNIGLEKAISPQFSFFVEIEGCDNLTYLNGLQINNAINSISKCNRV